MADESLEIIETSPTERFVKYNQLLGKGSFKEVHKGFDNDSGIEIAWNTIRTKADVSTLEKIKSEIYLLRKLNHESIINFHDSWLSEDKKEVVFITECMTSGTVKQYLANKVLKWNVLGKWARQVLQGVAYLHEQQPPIIHRDLKCENIFINGNTGKVKIGDLGLSKIHRRDATQSVLGTPEFMAPELYDENYDEKVDIYAFGMVLIEMVTHEYPYAECENSAQIYKKVLKNQMPEQLAKVMDFRVRSVIEMCLERDVNRRPGAKTLLEMEIFSDAYLKSEQGGGHVGPPIATIAEGRRSAPSSTDRAGEGLDELDRALEESELAGPRPPRGDAPSAHRAPAPVHRFEQDRLGPAKESDTTGVGLQDGSSMDQSATVLPLRLFTTNNGKKVEVKFDYNIADDSPETVAEEMISELELSEELYHIIVTDIKTSLSKHKALSQAATQAAAAAEVTAESQEGATGSSTDPTPHSSPQNNAKLPVVSGASVSESTLSEGSVATHVGGPPSASPEPVDVAMSALPPTEVSPQATQQVVEDRLQEPDRPVPADPSFAVPDTSATYADAVKRLSPQSHALAVSSQPPRVSIGASVQGTSILSPNKGASPNSAVTASTQNRNPSLPPKPPTSFKQSDSQDNLMEESLMKFDSPPAASVQQSTQRPNPSTPGVSIPAQQRPSVTANTSSPMPGQQASDRGVSPRPRPPSPGAMSRVASAVDDSKQWQSVPRTTSLSTTRTTSGDDVDDERSPPIISRASYQETSQLFKPAAEGTKLSQNEYEARVSQLRQQLSAERDELEAIHDQERREMRDRHKMAWDNLEERHERLKEDLRALKPDDECQSQVSGTADDIGEKLSRPASMVDVKLEQAQVSTPAPAKTGGAQSSSMPGSLSRTPSINDLAAKGSGHATPLNYQDISDSDSSIPRAPSFADGDDLKQRLKRESVVSGSLKEDDKKEDPEALRKALEQKQILGLELSLTGGTKDMETSSTPGVPPSAMQTAKDLPRMPLSVSMPNNLSDAMNGAAITGMASSSVTGGASSAPQKGVPMGMMAGSSPTNLGADGAPMAQDFDPRGSAGSREAFGAEAQVGLVPMSNAPQPTLNGTNPGKGGPAQPTAQYPPAR